MGPPRPGPHSPGRAAHRCPPASRACRSRTHLRGCRPPRGRRRSSHCSSGPTSRWGTAGHSRGPATLRARDRAVSSLSRVRTVFCPLPQPRARQSARTTPPPVAGLARTSRLRSPLGAPVWLLGAQGLEAGSPCSCYRWMIPPGQGISGGGVLSGPRVDSGSLSQGSVFGSRW